MRAIRWAGAFGITVIAVSLASCSSTPSDTLTPRRSPPYLSAVYPDPLHIWAIPRVSAAGSPAAFAPSAIVFDVASEDLGDDLEAAVVLDYRGSAGANGVVVGQGISIPAGHFDDPQPRHAEMAFTVPTGTEAGCHSLTLIVSHQFVPLQPIPAQPGDVAHAVWWLDVDDDIAVPTATMARCLALPAGGSDGGP